MPDSLTYNCDCIDFMRLLPDNAFDLCIADPQYGCGEDGGKNRDHYVRQKNGTKLFVSDGSYEAKNWDKEPAGKDFFREVLRVSKNQIIWGVNYFDCMRFTPGRIVWDKCNDGSDQSDCEIAWNSMTDRVDMFRFMWRGMMQGKSITEGTVQQGNKKLNEKRIHPAQKPVALYIWTLQKFAKSGWKIFDPMMGSQSSRIAAAELGFDYCGCEKDEDYFRSGTQRFEEYTAQGSLFRKE